MTHFHCALQQEDPHEKNWQFPSTLDFCWAPTYNLELWLFLLTENVPKGTHPGQTQLNMKNMKPCPSGSPHLHHYKGRILPEQKLPDGCQAGMGGKFTCSHLRPGLPSGT